MWCVRTASRLHLGLLSLPADGERYPDRHGEPVLPARRYGGVGLMIDAPGVQLRATPAEQWSAEGTLAERALAFARSMVAALNEPTLPPRRLVVDQAAREHVGLGTGTQLGLAVARALAASWDRSIPVPRLASLVRRGSRSSLGIHGFAHGGFLVEAGKSIGHELAPLVARVDWPADWRVLIAIPPVAPGCHGDDERAVFAGLAASPPTTEALCRLVLLGMLPALHDGDLQAFGEAVFDFNARVGQVFAAAQGGTYSSAAVAGVVEFFRRQGVAGVGQSSWGPGVFAFVSDEDRATALRQQTRDYLGADAEVWVARGVNHGATAT